MNSRIMPVSLTQKMISAKRSEVRIEMYFTALSAQFINQFINLPREHSYPLPYVCKRDNISRELYYN